MEFQIGQLFIKTIEGDRVTIVVPIGSVMFAANVELFNIGGHKSIAIKAEVYEREDGLVNSKIERWLRGE